VRIARRGGATPEDVLNCRDMVLPGR
jgi:hypothetical protein